MSESERIKILVVDDNTDLAMALHLSLEDHPTVDSIGWVDTSDRIVETVQSKRPQVVLLDLTMPGVDPLDALRQIRTLGTEVKVIAFSGYDDSETIAHARAAGADGFLRKSVDPVAIVDAVQRVMRSKA